MKNKKIITIIAIVIFVNLGLFLYFRLQDQTKVTPAPQQLGPTLSPGQFDQTTPVDQQAVNQPDVQEDTSPADQSVVQDLPSANVDQPAAQESDFSISGVLIGDGNPWTLIYDDAAIGAPAATLELVFNDSSLCDFGQGDTSCTPMYFEVGTGIQVTGQKDGTRLIVSKIKRSVSLMTQ